MVCDRRFVFYIGSRNPVQSSATASRREGPRSRNLAAVIRRCGFVDGSNDAVDPD
jgi:hypothetical protein